MNLIAASQQSQLHITFAVLVAGVVIGCFGHITRLRWLIVLGIFMIGADSLVFWLWLRPGAG
jgi:uncharacterized membrane protein YjjB (DUF3815 family)